MQVLEDALAYFKLGKHNISEVVCGDAKGADTLGKQWAQANGVPVKFFKPDWDNITAPGAKVKTNTYGKPYNVLAGFWRNQEMAEYSTSFLGLQSNGDTSGTQDGKERFEKLEKEVFIYSGQDKKQAKKTVKGGTSEPAPFDSSEFLYEF